MNCSPTLTAQEFTDLHNGLCDLRYAMQQLEDVINPALYKRLSSGMMLIDKGLKSAYEQDRSAFARKNSYYTKYAEQHKLRAVWSDYDVEDFSKPHPYGNVTELVYADHWGPKDVKVPIEGNTWGDLYTAADAAIKASGDDHHIYIEQFRVAKSGTFFLSTGS